MCKFSDIQYKCTVSYMAVSRKRILAPESFELFLRQGSNALDSSASTARSSSVMLSAAKHLAADRDRPFAEFTLSEAHGLRVTRCDCPTGQGHFVQIEPCLFYFIAPTADLSAPTRRHGITTSRNTTGPRVGSSSLDWLTPA